MTAPLRIVAEDGEGRRVGCTLHGVELRVGRAPGSGLRLDDRNVSRLHCRLFRYGAHLVVEDMGSANGTFVNGRRLNGRHQLREADVVSVGDWDITIEGPGLLTADPEAVTASMPVPMPPRPDGGEGAAPAATAGAWWRRVALLVLVAGAAAAAGYAAGTLLRREPPPAAPIVPVTPR